MWSMETTISKSSVHKLGAETRWKDSSLIKKPFFYWKVFVCIFMPISKIIRVNTLALFSFSE